MKQALSILIALIAICSSYNVVKVASLNIVPGNGIPDRQQISEQQETDRLEEQAINSDDNINNDEPTDSNRNFRFKAARSNVELFTSRKQQMHLKNRGVGKFVGGLITGAIQKQTTKMATKAGLIYRFFPEEGVYAKNEESAKNSVKVMNERNKKNLEKWTKENAAWYKEAMKSIGGYSWGDKVLCASCQLILERAWHYVEKIEEPDEDDVYNAIGDVCSEHISITEEACQKIEADSSRATQKILESSGMDSVCIELELCTPKTLSEYQFADKKKR